MYDDIGAMMTFGIRSGSEDSSLNILPSCAPFCWRKKYERKIYENGVRRS